MRRVIRRLRATFTPSLLAGLATGTFLAAFAYSIYCVQVRRNACATACFPHPGVMTNGACFCDTTRTAP